MGNLTRTPSKARHSWKRLCLTVHAILSHLTSKEPTSNITNETMDKCSNYQSFKGSIVHIHTCTLSTHHIFPDQMLEVKHHSLPAHHRRVTPSRESILSGLHSTIHLLRCTTWYSADHLIGSLSYNIRKLITVALTV